MTEEKEIHGTRLNAEAIMPFTAAYALVPILSGMTFDMTTYTLGLTLKLLKKL